MSQANKSVTGQSRQSHRLNGLSKSVAHTRVASLGDGAPLQISSIEQPIRLMTVSTPQKGSTSRRQEKYAKIASRFDQTLPTSPGSHQRGASELGPISNRHTMDATFRKTGLSVGQVAGTQKNEPFGFQFYRSPAHDTKYRISLGNTLVNQQRKSFVETESRARSYVPAPKIKHSDWRQNIPGRAGKFLGRARKTFTDEIMEAEKKTPAPSKFDNWDALKKKLHKIPGNYTLKDGRRGCHDTEKWLSRMVPDAKYNNTNVKLVKPKTYAAVIAKPTEGKFPSWQIPKMDGPGPGSYNDAEAQKSTQWSRVKGQSKQTNFPPSFTDKHKKMFAHVPGSGHYKQMETAKDGVAKDTNFKYKRH